ncbi:hypothetical protein N7462_002139 [Penicillium macrosclerotiorum]|uniref:uncharacterized protein n=1 Tax=Penicillium macrosclerotiorum TaxID=303699 RepID=UPI002546795E|nr:uncharacterized protein N7462_002139 [Penicillium macrosclerotiorum]KAJ5692716.1 hypothetical protein N7462_002139 [Penicillium macrosclerotiorum]
MNWTGGQLQRHATHQGLLSKTQRQHFARSRQLAGNKSLRQPSSLHAGPDSNGPGDDSMTRNGQEPAQEEIPDLSVRNGQTLQLQVLASHVRVGELTSPRTDSALVACCRSTISNQSTILKEINTDLDALKYQLLQETDWATTSAARPLEITFTPVEDIERFGKRRRLNDADRKRLSTDLKSHIPLAFSTSNCKARGILPYDNPRPQQVQIPTHGEGTTMESNNTRDASTNKTSSHSMLLQQDEATVPRTPLAKPPADWTPSGKPVLNRRFCINPRRQNQVNSSQVVLSAPVSTGSPVPRRWGSTIDNQVLTNEIWFNSKSPSDQWQPHETPRRPRETVSPSPTLIVTDMLSPRETPTWFSQRLPRPSRTNYAPNSHLQRPGVIHLQEPSSRVDSRFNLSNSLLSSMDPYISATVKIFGQAVYARDPQDK